VDLTFRQAPAFNASSVDGLKKKVLKDCCPCSSSVSFSISDGVRRVNFLGVTDGFVSFGLGLSKMALQKRLFS
jgi:hypothetical protein